MSSFNFWASVPLGVHSFIIYSFLLDPLVLETSRLDVQFRLYHLQLFSSMYELTAQRQSFRLSLNFLKLINIFSFSFLYFLSFNVTGHTTICPFLKGLSSKNLRTDWHVSFQNAIKILLLKIHHHTFLTCCRWNAKNNIYIVTPPCAQRACRVPSSPVKAGHRRWLWFAERYLMSQISPTPKQNHILKLLGKFYVNYWKSTPLTGELSPSNTRSSTNTILPQEKKDSELLRLS